MARATSLSFSPDDNATFALACWDGRTALFLPITTTAAPSPGQTGESLLELPHNRRVKCGSDALGRAWKPVWREKAAPVKPGGGKGENLEDQDGAFLCWCKGPDSNSPADLAVSMYDVIAGTCTSRERRGDGGASDAGGSLEMGGVLPEYEASAANGPGFELFAGGLGERVGGAITGLRPAGVTEPTAERYLIHGLAADRSCLALYDSDQCLHVVSLAAILDAHRVLSPPRRRPATTGGADKLPEDAASMTGDVDKIAPDSKAAETLSPPTAKVTLVSNDHGVIAAEVGRDRGSGGRGSDTAPPEPEGLRLSITWRNAVTGVETPDDGECIGKAGGSDRRLPFLPDQLASLDGNEEDGGVLGADVRWGRLALFTRSVVLVHTRATERESSKASEAGVGSGFASPDGWRAYLEYPIVHGVLFGGERRGCRLDMTICDLLRSSGGLMS